MASPRLELRALRRTHVRREHAPVDENGRARATPADVVSGAVHGDVAHGEGYDNAGLRAHGGVNLGHVDPVRGLRGLHERHLVHVGREGRVVHDRANLVRDQRAREVPHVVEVGSRGVIRRRDRIGQVRQDQGRSRGAAPRIGRDDLDVRPPTRPSLVIATCLHFPIQSVSGVAQCERPCRTRVFRGC